MKNLKTFNEFVNEAEAYTPEITVSDIETDLYKILGTTNDTDIYVIPDTSDDKNLMELFSNLNKHFVSRKTIGKNKCIQVGNLKTDVEKTYSNVCKVETPDWNAFFINMKQRDIFRYVTNNSSFEHERDMLTLEEFSETY